MAQSPREIYWSAILADFRRSGLTHVEFCQLRSIFHPLLPRLALSAPTWTPSSSLTRVAQRLSSPFAAPGRSARLPAGPCPSPISDPDRGSSRHPASSPTGTGHQTLSPPSPRGLRSRHAPSAPRRPGGTVVINFPPAVRIFLASSPADMPPWLRRSGGFDHLGHRSGSAFRSSLRIPESPRRSAEDPVLGPRRPGDLGQAIGTRCVSLP